MGTLRVVSHGQGPRVVLALHGLAGTAETFAPLLPYVPADVRLVMVDLPGYGASAAPAAWTIPAVADAVHAGVASSLPGSGPVAVLGNCSGAIIAAELHRAHPHRYEDLRLIEPFAYVPWYFDLFTWPLFGPTAFYSTFHTSAGRWLTNRGLRDVGRDDVDKTSGFENSAWDTPIRYLRALKRVGTAEAYRGTNPRVRIARGAGTFEAVTRSVERWQAVWPDAVVDVLEGAGHLPIQEAPESLAASLLADRRGGASTATA